MRVILYTGKGGVGKATLAAATALHRAAPGQRALVVNTDIAHLLADALQTTLGNEPRRVGRHGLEAAEFDSASERKRAWGESKQRISTLLQQKGVVATAAGELAVLPGLDEVLSLVRVKRFYDERRYDDLILD